MDGLTVGLIGWLVLSVVIYVERSLAVGKLQDRIQDLEEQRDALLQKMSDVVSPEASAALRGRREDGPLFRSHVSHPDGSVEYSDGELVVPGVPRIPEPRMRLSDAER